MRTLKEEHLKVIRQTLKYLYEAHTMLCEDQVEDVYTDTQSIACQMGIDCEENDEYFEIVEAIEDIRLKLIEIRDEILDLTTAIEDDIIGANDLIDECAEPDPDDADMFEDGEEDGRYD